MTTPALRHGLGKRIRTFAASASFLFITAAFAFAAEPETKSFNLPSGEAERSLKLFSEQSRLEVLFPTAAVAGVRTRAVTGQLTPREALDAMLAGTQLVAEHDERTGSITVRRDNGSAAAKKNAVAADSANDTSGSVRSDGTIELSPFEVHADQDSGYAATSSLAGSRLNTELRDIGATINVLTSEFIADIGATSVEEALLYGQNIQPNFGDDSPFTQQTGGNGIDSVTSPRTYRVRGLPATLSRNYFDWNLPLDTFNVERIEQSQGPNSVLFGIGSAGGIINLLTKQANLRRSFVRLSATVGSESLRRGTLDYNRALLNDKLALRVNLAWDQRESYRHHAGDEDRRGHIAAKYALTSRTTVRAEFERGQLRQNSPRPWGLFDDVSSWVAAGSQTFAQPPASEAEFLAAGVEGRGAVGGFATYIVNEGRVYNLPNELVTTSPGNNFLYLDPAFFDRSINVGGPGQDRHTRYNAVSVFLEQRLARKTFLELAYNHQDSNTFGIDSGNQANLVVADPNRLLPNGAANPYAGQYYLDANWTRREREFVADTARLTLSHEIDVAKWGNYRFAAMGERSVNVSRGETQLEVWEGAPFSAANARLPENQANWVWRRSYIKPGDFRGMYVNGPAETGPLTGVSVLGSTVGPLTSTWVAQNANALNDDPKTQLTFLLGGQVRYFDGRLIIGGGYRNDRVKFTERAAVRNPATQLFGLDYDNAASNTHFIFDAATRTLSVVGHVTSWFSLRYNRSSSIAIPNTNLRVLPPTIPPGFALPSPPENDGEDMGFALELLDGKINLRATRYTTSGRNQADAHGFGSTNTSPQAISINILDPLVAAGRISQAESDLHRVTANGATYDRDSEGYELSMTANITRGWQLQLTASQTESVESNIGSEIVNWATTEIPYYRSLIPLLATPQQRTQLTNRLTTFTNNLDDAIEFEGLEQPGGAKYKGNVFTKYTFQTGPLRGLGLGGGFRYIGKQVAGRSVNADGTTTFLYGNATPKVDFTASYKLRVQGRKTVNFQLNVKNLLNDDDPVVTRFIAGQIARVKFEEPITWRLQVAHEF